MNALNGLKVYLREEEKRKGKVEKMINQQGV